MRALRMWRHGAALFGALALTGALAACGSSDDNGGSASTGAAGGSTCDKGTIKVAFSGPMSGSGAPYGTGQLRGMQLAAQQINDKGGISAGPYKNCKIEVTQFDDKADPAVGSQIASRLRGQDDYLAYFGNVFSAVTLAAAPILSRAGYPIVTTYSSSPEVTEQGYDNLFRTIPNDDQLGGDAARVLAEEFGRKRIAVLWSNDTYGQGIIKEFRRVAAENGAELVVDQSYQPGDTDFSVLVSKVKEANPDGIALEGAYAENGLLAKQLAAAGVKAGPDRTIIGTGADNTPEFVKLAGPAANGIYVQALWNPETATADGKSFGKAFEDKFGSPPPEYAATSYDGLMMMAKALADGDAGDREGLISALQKYRDQTYTGVAGEVKFDDHNQNILGKSSLLEIKDGKFVPVNK